MKKEGGEWKRISWDQAIGEIGRLAGMVEDLHAGDDGVPAGLHLVLDRMDRVLKTYMELAETVFFPAIRGGMTPGLAPRIDALRADHDRLGNDCSQIWRISQEFTVPEGACRCWATLYSRLAELIGDLTAQIRLEKEILAARLDPGSDAPV